jgi:hypothetical protein
LGTSYALLGDLTEARAHVECALSLYDPNQHRPGRFALESQLNDDARPYNGADR